MDGLGVCRGGGFVGVKRWRFGGVQRWRVWGCAEVEGLGWAEVEGNGGKVVREGSRRGMFLVEQG